MERPCENGLSCLRWAGLLGCSVAAKAPTFPGAMQCEECKLQVTLAALIPTHQRLCFPLVSERLLSGTVVRGGAGVVGEDGW